MTAQCVEFLVLEGGLGKKYSYSTSQHCIDWNLWIQHPLEFSYNQEARELLGSVVVYPTSETSTWISVITKDFQYKEHFQYVQLYGHMGITIHFSPFMPSLPTATFSPSSQWQIKVVNIRWRTICFSAFLIQTFNSTNLRCTYFEPLLCTAFSPG